MLYAVVNPTRSPLKSDWLECSKSSKPSKETKLFLVSVDR
jgi:hypothetical protein